MGFDETSTILSNIHGVFFLQHTSMWKWRLLGVLESRPKNRLQSCVCFASWFLIGTVGGAVGSMTKTIPVKIGASQTGKESALVPNPGRCGAKLLRDVGLLLIYATLCVESSQTSFLHQAFGSRSTFMVVGESVN